jgi:hypothetical protein
MNANDVMKTYAIFYVSENDEFDTAKKLDMLTFIEQADETMLMDLFENGEIEPPFGLLDEDNDVDDKELSTLLGEAMLLIEEAAKKLEERDILTGQGLQSYKDLLGMKTNLNYKLAKATAQGKRAIHRSIANIDKKIDALKSSAGKAVEAGKDMASDAGDAISKSAGKAGKAVKGVTDDAGKALEKGAKSVHKVAGEVGDKVAGAAGKAAEFAQGHGGAIAAAAGAAAALTAGVMAYRKYFSKAAQACKGAADKNACMAQHKIKAKQAQVSALNAGKAKCAKTNKPEQCKIKIDGKINTLKAKMRG